ncbi:MAG TPA: metallophosphoesterase family protein [Kofleriaceae bacterium]|nr:metallophosphoesterase family protein [Kofleriaceae bacterium]
MRMGAAPWLLCAALAACSSSPSNTDPDGGGGDDGGGSGDDGSVPIVDPEWPADEALPADFDFPPYANLVDGTTVAISWRTVAASTGVVRYGTTPDLGAEAASTTSANLHHITLSSLTPKAAYYYEVSIDGTSAVRKGVFVMPGREQWRFLHSGEFHAPSESSNVTKFTAKIREFRPHVLLESGDMVDDGNDLADWRSYMKTSAPWISNVLILPAHSNHVNGSGGNANLKDLFVLPNNERWYTTRYGQVEFFSLDSTFAANSDVETVEVPWVADEVTAAHDGTDDPTFVIAAWHHPACSSQYFTRQSERSWVQDNFVATFVAKGGVDLILAAHDKYYERSTITGGIVHVITNIGNVSPEIPGGNYETCTAVKTSRSDQSTALFTVDGRTLSATVLKADGSQLDSFSIAK